MYGRKGQSRVNRVSATPQSEKSQVSSIFDPHNKSVPSPAIAPQLVNQGFPLPIPLSLQRTIARRERLAKQTRRVTTNSSATPPFPSITGFPAHKISGHTQNKTINGIEDDISFESTKRSRRQQVNEDGSWPNRRILHRSAHMTAARKADTSQLMTAGPSYTPFRNLDNVTPDESMDTSEDEDEEPPIIYRSHRKVSKKSTSGARKRPPPQQDSSDSSSSSSETSQSDTNIALREVDSDVEESPIEPIGHIPRYTGIPFLLRNLPRQLRVTTCPEGPITLRTCYRGPNLPTHQAQIRVNHLYCPFFCGAPLSEFGNLTGLRFHLKYSHPQVKSECSSAMNNTIFISLFLPAITTVPHRTPTRPLGKCTRKQKLLAQPTTSSLFLKNRLHRRISLDSLASMYKSTSPEPDLSIDHEPTPRSPSPTPTIQPRHSSHSSMYASTSPEPIPAPSLTPTPSTESSSRQVSLPSGTISTSERETSTTNETDAHSSADRIPSDFATHTSLKQPPPNDPLGPAAQPPYCNPEEGGLPFSCRIGGEKIYDILAELSIEEFGIAAAEIRDREEEIFDADDISDEMKAMQALWARWIWWSKNRHSMASNPSKALPKFLSQYWLMIHRCCGFRVLSYFMAMLCQMQIITGVDIQASLKYYTSKTRMDEWAPIAQSSRSRKVK